MVYKYATKPAGRKCLELMSAKLPISNARSARSTHTSMCRTRSYRTVLCPLLLVYQTAATFYLQCVCPFLLSYYTREQLF